MPPKPSTTYDFCSGQLECVDYNPQYHADSNGHYISDWMFAAIQSTLEYMTPQSLADQCTTSIWAKYSAWSRSTFSLVPLRTETITYDQGYSTKPLIVTTTLHSFGLFEIELQPPCCGGCNLSVAYASLLYWPTPAPSPPMTKVVSANHTLFVPLPKAFLKIDSNYRWTAYIQQSMYGIRISERGMDVPTRQYNLMKLS